MLQDNPDFTYSKILADYDAFKLEIDIPTFEISSTAKTTVVKKA
jgi:hypothetical protein